MGKEIRIYRLTFLVIVSLIAVYGCSNKSSSVAPATATALAERAIRMATDMAANLQTTAEVMNRQVQATAESRQALLDEIPLWSVIILDTFDDNNQDWAEGEAEDPRYARVNWTFDNGKYRWEANANDGFVWWVIPDMGELTDLYLAVTAQQLNNPEFGEYGMLFRKTGDGDYYLFEIDEKGRFAVYLHSQGEWESLLDWQYAPEIKVGEKNRLAVIAQGVEYQLFINDQFLGYFVDDRLEVGKAGLLVGLSYPDEEAVWEFDDFELRSPNGSSHGPTSTPFP